MEVPGERERERESFEITYVSQREKTKKKFKIITALSVFYDALEPNKFLKDVKNLLSKDGIVHEDGLFCVIEELLHEEKIQLSNRENIQFIVSGNLELLQKSKGTLIKVSINFCILYRYHLTLKYIDRLWIN